VVSRNSYKFDIKQKLNIAAEIGEQRAALEGGKTATETLLTAGQVPDKAVDVSNQAFRERHQIPQEAAIEAAAKSDSGNALLDFLNPWGKPYKTDSWLRKTTGAPVGSKTPLGGLGGMNRSNHILEDVSGTYAGDRMTTLGSAPMRDQSEKSKLDEFYLVNGVLNDLSGPSLDWLGSAPVRPNPVQQRRVVQAPQFGSAYNNSNLAKKKGRVMSERSFRDGRRRI